MMLNRASGVRIRAVHSDAKTALVAAQARRIIYIFCNPATLARDLKRMSATYRLGSIRSFDLFPQTAHVESVALLVAV